jgi:glycosyltransferase involved in cell wall biosynthesis
MNITVTNITNTDQSLDKYWIRPQESLPIPIEIAVRYEKAPCFVFDWDSVHFTPSIVKRKLQGLAFATPLSLFDGYGLIGVYTVREFIKQGIDLDLYNCGWLIERDLDQDILAKLNEPKKYYDLALAKGPPSHVLGLIPNAVPINYSMWESDRLPTDWVPMLNKLPLVIVPTKAQIQIYRDSGVTVPMTIVPDPIDTEYWCERKVQPQEGIFKIVSWSNMTSRKMPIEMVTAFQQAFPRTEYPDVEFHLKTSRGNFGGGEGIIPRFEDDRIHIINGSLLIDDLRDWVSSAHCAFFLSRGEGMFNPPMQSMALGVPTIIPDHTGPADYADTRWNWPIPLDTHTPLVKSPMGEGMRWWNPDTGAAIAQLRNVYHDYGEALRRAVAAKAMIKRRYNVPLFVQRLSKELVKVRL